MLPLHEQARPSSWDELVGQDEAQKQIAALRRRGLVGRVILLTGPSGTGKTSAARLIAGEVCGSYDPVEMDALDVSLDTLREFDRMCRTRPVGAAAHAFILNEIHNLNTKAVSRMQTLFEAPHVVRNSTWVLTTTNKGQQRMFDTRFDAMPFLSRAHRISFTAHNELAFALRVRDIAQQNELDGRPIESYIALIREHKGNLRSALNAVESGSMLG